MNQRDFDSDLTINFDDTGPLMKFPEQEEGFLNNPIRMLFECPAVLDVEDEEQDSGL